MKRFIKLFSVLSLFSFILYTQDNTGTHYLQMVPGISGSFTTTDNYDEAYKIKYMEDAYRIQNYSTKDEKEVQWSILYHQD